MLFNGTCEAEVAAFLDCAPALLSVDCVVGYPESWLGEQCISANDDVLMCVDSSCSGSIDAVGGGCTASLQCAAGDFSIDCTPDGECDCRWNDWLVGSCQTIFSAFDGCVPNLSCCSAFF